MYHLLHPSAEHFFAIDLQFHQAPSRYHRHCQHLCLHPHRRRHPPLPHPRTHRGRMYRSPYGDDQHRMTTMLSQPQNAIDLEERGYQMRRSCSIAAEARRRRRMRRTEGSSLLFGCRWQAYDLLERMNAPVYNKLKASLLTASPVTYDPSRCASE